MSDANSAGLLTRLKIVEDVLGDHANALGNDLTAYRNHVYRVANLGLAFVGHSRDELEKISIAAVFHDIGIWTHHTFDYLDPSAGLARNYLATRGKAAWIPEIESMVVNHHKVMPVPGSAQSLAESFRRADWIDVTRGIRTFGLPRSFIAAVITTWPNAGFHRRLVALTIDRFVKHPLSPLPMFRW